MRDGRSGACVASRVALLTVRREVKRPKQVEQVQTHARHTHARALCHCGPRTLAWPALGFVRRACDGARVLAALGGLASSGVACGGTSSEEGEEYHDRATVNHEHVQPAGKSELVLTLEAV